MNKGAITNKDQDDREEEILEMADRRGEIRQIEEMEVKDKIEEIKVMDKIERKEMKWKQKEMKKYFMMADR